MSPRHPTARRGRDCHPCQGGCPPLNNCSRNRFARFSCWKWFSACPQLSCVMQAKINVPLQLLSNKDLSWGQVPKWWVFHAFIWISFLSFFFIFYFYVSAWLFFLQPFSWLLVLFLWSSAWGIFFLWNYQWLRPPGNPQALRNSALTSFKQSETSVSPRLRTPSQFQSAQTPSRLTRSDIRLTTQLSFLRLIIF